jgi:uncharacterized ferredoxin-like protein
MAEESKKKHEDVSVVLSAHFADPKDAELIRRVAKKLRTSPSAVLRDAALRMCARVEETCPTCGQRKQGKAKAPKKSGKAQKTQAPKTEAAAA